MASIKKWVLILGCVILVLFLIQLIPYGKKHTNPPILSEINWNTPRTRFLFYNACKDCHTNETSWNWYGQIAPASWVFQSAVEDGRAMLNVSEWIPGRPVNKGRAAANEVKSGNMPPWYYSPVQPDAWLNKEEKDALISGLIMTFGEK